MAEEEDKSRVERSTQALMDSQREAIGVLRELEGIKASVAALAEGMDELKDQRAVELLRQQSRDKRVEGCVTIAQNLTSAKALGLYVGLIVVGVAVYTGAEIAGMGFTVSAQDCPPPTKSAPAK